MKTKFKVRFHLGQGPHFMHWQVRSGRSVQYFDPNLFVLSMGGAKLVNQPSTARKIHAGDHKTVCAWIECQELKVLLIGQHLSSPSGTQVCYNPRVAPFWTDDKNVGTNLDGKKFESLITFRKKVYTNS